MMLMKTIITWMPIFFLLHKSVVTTQPVICRIVSCRQIGNGISRNEDPAAVEGLSHSNHTVEDLLPSRVNERFIALTPLEIKPKDLVPSSFKEIFKIFTFSFHAKWHKEILHSIDQVAAFRGEDKRRSSPLS